MELGEQYLAFDLGAESGRAVLGTLNDGRLKTMEISRFANHPVRVMGSLHWNVLHLWQEIKNSLALVGQICNGQLDGIGVDTWGQDYALLDKNGSLLGLPYHYQDSRTEGILDELRQHVSEWTLYQLTGISEFPISTLCQLLAFRRHGREILGVAKDLLLMPGLFTFWLTGQKANEASAAGISQAYDLTTGDWNYSLLSRLQLPTDLLAPVTPTASIVGPLHRPLMGELELKPTSVVATAGHDTAAAVAAVPKHQNCTFISSGTWSVIGKDLPQPLISQEAMGAGFLNELGACGRTMFAYNLVGLWLLQECRRAWAKSGHDWTYRELVNAADEASPFAMVIDVEHPVLFGPKDMLTKIADYCRLTGQDHIPAPGQITRAILEGLALQYRSIIQRLETVTALPTEIIHIVGGGAQNPLLCQFTADATGKPVLAGPVEATACGNILLQALACGTLASLDEVKEVIARSFELIYYEPHVSTAWNASYES
jgi:rhamnulokinase